MASFWLPLLPIMSLLLFPFLSSSATTKLNSQFSTISSLPVLVSRSPTTTFPFQELSPDIAPLLPSPGGKLPSPASSMPTIPSNPSPPNPDNGEPVAAGPDSAFSPPEPFPASSAPPPGLVSSVLALVCTAYWLMQLVP
ncbi:hypothetical protein K2173_022424 [Erythroxylum novogranatense]|uniref:Uncharacterized protein n=1 Tax=Erythroxylum novogranatense TaxID=1862640 RepID=A0AAV8TK20_9ROSI|nr:hypothetical protein K2173_022424 [Erythroxylum novogranatense]